MPQKINNPYDDSITSGGTAWTAWSSAVAGLVLGLVLCVPADIIGYFVGQRLLGLEFPLTTLNLVVIVGTATWLSVHTTAKANERNKKTPDQK